MESTEAHLNNAISHLDELAANSTNLDKKLNRNQWEAVKQARALLLRVAESIDTDEE